MALAKIKQLRNERLSKINSLKQQKEKIKADQTLADTYKSEMQTKLDADIKATNQEYEPQINELIQQREMELRTGFNSAEYQGMDDKQAMVELLKEMRNQRLTDSLIRQYEGKDMASLRNDLSKQVNDLIQVNSPETGAYINAMKSLGAVGFEDLERQYKENNMNDLQKAYQSDLNLIEEQKQEFHTEVNGDPFENILAKYED